jgi:hypothetical protein
MALWKPFVGNHTNLDVVPKHSGHVYWCTDNGTLFFDYTDADGVVQRKQVNAQDAETLGGQSLDSIFNSINSTVDKISTISLPASGWTTATNIYSQVVTVSGATANSKVDIYPTPEQLVELQSAGIALVAVNEDGIVTVYALNNKPTSDYSIQVTLTEVHEEV